MSGARSKARKDVAWEKYRLLAVSALSEKKRRRVIAEKDEHV